MKTKYGEKMESVVKFIDDYSRRLSHPVKDLDDIRFKMAALADIRSNEIRIDREIGPIEVISCTYLLRNIHELSKYIHIFLCTSCHC